MFTLRFFAGPIVHKINPVGLLFASASLGTIGLYLLGNPMVTNYGVAVDRRRDGLRNRQDFLLADAARRDLGAIPEGRGAGAGLERRRRDDWRRPPRRPGHRLQARLLRRALPGTDHEGQETYNRYMARNEKGEPEKTSFPIVTSILPNKCRRSPESITPSSRSSRTTRLGSPPTEAQADAKTTLESDLDTLARQEKEGKTVEPKLKENLTKLKHWWDTEGLSELPQRQEPLTEARLYGAKNALLYTAVVPLVLAIGFMILIVYFYATGGYKQVHLDEDHPPMEEY